MGISLDVRVLEKLSQPLDMFTIVGVVLHVFHETDYFILQDQFSPFRFLQKWWYDGCFGRTFLPGTNQLLVSLTLFLFCLFGLCGLFWFCFFGLRFFQALHLERIWECLSRGRWQSRHPHFYHHIGC